MAVVYRKYGRKGKIMLVISTAHWRAVVRYEKKLRGLRLCRAPSGRTGRVDTGDRPLINQFPESFGNLPKRRFHVLGLCGACVRNFFQERKESLMLTRASQVGLRSCGVIRSDLELPGLPATTALACAKKHRRRRGALRLQLQVNRRS